MIKTLAAGCLWMGLLAIGAAIAAEGSASAEVEHGVSQPTTLVAVEDAGKPLFELPSLDGGSHNLAQYRGRIVLVHFFATWCEPCRPEMAQLEALRANLAGQPFEIVAISVAEPDGAVRRFFMMPPPFSVLLDRDRAVAKVWNVDRLPTTIVLDFALKPRFIAEGELDWAREDVTSALALLLKEMPALPDVGGK
jgi:thiol-disulfide isomerase/thioredoxin